MVPSLGVALHSSAPGLSGNPRYEAEIVVKCLTPVETDLPTT
jgi:hypothetical protein